MGYLQRSGFDGRPTGRGQVDPGSAKVYGFVYVDAPAGPRRPGQWLLHDAALSRTRDAYIRRVNQARTVLLYAVSGVIGILLGLATAQATVDCSGSCAGARPIFATWQSGLIGLGCTVVVLIACALLDDEFIPVTRRWLRAARRRRSGPPRRRPAS
jgi:hypothetical protein